MKSFIIKYPNKLLINKSPDIKNSLELEILMNILSASANKINCLGLAAPQIGYNRRLFYVKQSEYFDKSFFMINPILEFSSNESEILEEGCLSLDETYLVSRPKEIIIKSTLNDLKTQVSFKYSGMCARIILHELDHLDGILILNKNL